MKDDALNVLDMLIRHELAIKELYEMFSLVFEDHEDFWKSIVHDEQIHAELLEGLRSDAGAGRWLQYEGQFKPQAIKTSTGYVENQTIRAKNGELSFMQALAIAKDLESALLERLSYKLKKSAPQELLSVLMRLTDETEQHMERIALIYASEKQKA